MCWRTRGRPLLPRASRRQAGRAFSTSREHGPRALATSLPDAVPMARQTSGRGWPTTTNAFRGGFMTLTVHGRRSPFVLAVRSLSTGTRWHDRTQRHEDAAHPIWDSVARSTSSSSLRVARLGLSWRKVRLSETYGRDDFELPVPLTPRDTSPCGCRVDRAVARMVRAPPRCWRGRQTAWPCGRWRDTAVSTLPISERRCCRRARRVFESTGSHAFLCSTRRLPLVTISATAMWLLALVEFEAHDLALPVRCCRHFLGPLVDEHTMRYLVLLR